MSCGEPERGGSLYVDSYKNAHGEGPCVEKDKAQVRLLRPLKCPLLRKEA